MNIAGPALWNGHRSAQASLGCPVAKDGLQIEHRVDVSVQVALAHLVAEAALSVAAVLTLLADAKVAVRDQEAGRVK